MSESISKEQSVALIIKQTNCSSKEATDSLEKNGGVIVNALMDIVDAINEKQIEIEIANARKKHPDKEVRAVCVLCKKPIFVGQ